MAVDADMTKCPALEAGFMVMGMVMSKGCIMFTASPPDFGVSDGNFFFLG